MKIAQFKDKIEANIRLAVNRSGDSANLREREQAAHFLIEHADEAYPRLMELLQEKPGAWEAPRLIELLGYLRREESIPILQDLLLQGIEDVSRAAGRSLGVIAGAAASKALTEGLVASNTEIRIAAIEGIRVSKGETWCSAIAPALEDRDANLRYYAVNAAAELGCLDIKRLQNIAEHDEDAYVRQLAMQWGEKLKK
jgi:HEAT repeat protein